MGEAVAEQQSGRAQEAAAQGLAPREARAGRANVTGVGGVGIHGWLLSLCVCDIMLQREKGGAALSRSMPEQEFIAVDQGPGQVDADLVSFRDARLHVGFDSRDLVRSR